MNGVVCFLCVSVLHIPNASMTTFDRTPPVLFLMGSPFVWIPLGEPYIDAGAFATDTFFENGQVVHDILPVDVLFEYRTGVFSVWRRVSEVYSVMPGTYRITYKAADRAHNVTRTYRMVIVGQAEADGTPLPAADGLALWLVAGVLGGWGLGVVLGGARSRDRKRLT